MSLRFREPSYVRLLMYPGTEYIPIVERAEDYNRDVLAFLGG